MPYSTYRRKYRRNRGVNRFRRINKLERRIVKKAVLAAQRTDLQWIDALTPGTAASNTSTWAHRITGVAAGTDGDDRIGDKIHINKLDVILDIYRDPAFTGAAHNTVRVMIIQLLEPIGSAPILSNFTNGTGVAAVTAFHNIADGYDKRGRPVMYRVLMDKQIQLGMDQNENSAKYIRYSKTFKKPLQVDYSGGTVSYADTGKGEVWVFAASNVSSAAYPPIVQCQSRMFFSA